MCDRRLTRTRRKVVDNGCSPNPRTGSRLCGNLIRDQRELYGQSEAGQ